MSTVLSNLSFNEITTEAGLRLRNLTTGQRDAITSPLAGNLIENSTTNRANHYNGTTWNELAYLSDITGGSGIFSTVGSSGADYTTIADALTAGETNIAVITNVTETANFTFTSAVSVRIFVLPGITVTYGAFTPYNLSTFGVDLQIVGGRHNFVRGGTSNAFTSTSSSAKISISRALIDDSASTSTGYFSSVNNTALTGPLFTYSEIDFFGNNQVNSGFIGSNMNFGTCSFTGGGASASNMIVSGFNTKANNIELKGSFSSSQPVVDITNGSINGVLLESSILEFVLNNSFLSNVFTTSGGIDVKPTNQVYLSNIRSSNTTLTLNDSSQLKIDNSRISTIDDSNLTGSSTAKLEAVNTTFNSAVTLGQNSQGLYSISNSFFESNLSILDATANITNCYIGTSGGGQTFTTSGSTIQAILIGNRSATALSDAGQRTQDIANTTL